jgi:hypothetical protein
LASSKSNTDDVVTNKENNQTRRNTDTAAATSKRRGKSKSIRSDRNQEEEEEEGKGKDDKHDHASDSKLFQTTFKSIPSGLMLRRNHGLADQVLQASRSVSSSSSSKKQPVASLVLEEHENELPNDCRTLIKASTNCVWLGASHHVGINGR